MDKDTVSMQFVRAAVAQLPPAERAQVLAMAGISSELLGVAQARVPATAFAALWLAVAQTMDDEFFGLDSRRMKVGSFALLCHAVLHSENLGRALQRTLRAFALFLDDISGHLQQVDGQAIIRVKNRITDSAHRRFADETFLVMVHGLMCWLAGRRVALARAEFAYSRPDHGREYSVMFSQELRFDAAATAITFDSRWLRAPVVQNVESLKTFLRTAPQSVFLKYKNRDGWTARVRRRLRANIGSLDWPLLDDLAREFHLAPTTLRRRLEAEGGSYQAVKDELRRDAAIHHLCQSTLSVAEIAERLGFADGSAFHRAFKKWSGVQPGEYRRRESGAAGHRGAA